MTREALKELELDNKSVVKCKNMFALGICFYLFHRPEDHAKKYLDSKFARKNPLIAEANKRAIDAGYNFAANTHQFANTYAVPAAPLEKGTYRSINGNVAPAWGLMAAAEKAGLPLFCGSYPITPATVILEELAKHKELGVKTVQAEDEIAGICTAIGAAFAGNFAVTTTSGPGLSLKSEALGLAVMAELPLVAVPSAGGRRPARRPVDGSADQDRTERPDAGALRPQRRVSRGGARSLDARRLLPFRFRSG